MPKRGPEVNVRSLAPEAAEPEARPLHRPVRQLEDVDADAPFKVEYIWFTPEKAREWLAVAAAADGFQQRKLSLAEVRRWRSLITTERIVHMFPGGPLCTDEVNVLLNGQHRLTGLARCPDGTRVKFMVIRRVPRWMFAFFDTNKTRSVKDVFHIGGRPSGTQTNSAMKLAMRYEEFLTGRRSPVGWRHWNQDKDEHQDIDDFYSRRAELQDWYGVGEKVYRFSKLLIPSVMVFRFYQSLAWPEGDEAIQDFTELLVDSKRVPDTHPARRLTRWTQEAYLNKDLVWAKRELHLCLLFRSFQQMLNGSRIQQFSWAYGQPMAMPYHPKGHETAIKTVRLALDEMDAAP